MRARARVIGMKHVSNTFRVCVMYVSRRLMCARGRLASSAVAVAVTCQTGVAAPTDFWGKSAPGAKNGRSSLKFCRNCSCSVKSSWRRQGGLRASRRGSRGAADMLSRRKSGFLAWKCGALGLGLCFSPRIRVPLTFSLLHCLLRAV